jgi:hypothetical protein
VGTSTSHNPIGLHGLLQGQSYLLHFNVSISVSNSRFHGRMAGSIAAIPAEGHGGACCPVDARLLKETDSSIFRVEASKFFRNSGTYLPDGNFRIL